MHSVFGICQIENYFWMMVKAIVGCSVQHCRMSVSVMLISVMLISVWFCL